MKKLGGKPGGEPSVSGGPKHHDYQLKGVSEKKPVDEGQGALTIEEDKIKNGYDDAEEGGKSREGKSMVGVSEASENVAQPGDDDGNDQKSKGE
jgi:hypothetical protein